MLEFEADLALEPERELRLERPRHRFELLLGGHLVSAQDEGVVQAAEVEQW